MPLNVLTLTILAGQSLSDAVDGTAGEPVFLVGPVDWTDANISLQLSADNVNWGDLFLRGQEVLFPFKAGTTVLFAATLGGLIVKDSWIKIRSGSRDHPIVQEADRTFQIAIVS